MDLIHPHKSHLGPGNFLPETDGVLAACVGLAAPWGTSPPVSHSVCAPLFCLRLCAMWDPANLTTASLPIELGALRSAAQEVFMQASGAMAADHALP